MRKVVVFILFLLIALSITLAAQPCTSDLADECKHARGLLERLLPKQAANFSLSLLPSTDGADVFELASDRGKIRISGNTANSIAVGLQYYLKYYCHTEVSWYADDPIQLPEVLPAVAAKVSIRARCRDRFFLNYCTFGYTMPWWKWRDWERLIDWMALNGINMPLAVTGEEAVWYKVWKKFGLSDAQIRNYFTGPAHLPWHRMSNLDHWQGPLPMSYIAAQMTLQQKIVARERELDMRPVLPAFAGHVPQALQTGYPTAQISVLGSWGGFSDKYRSYFLNPVDPLFRKIQREFLREQTKLYGTSNIYGADPFNEVKPPSLDTGYLSNVARTIYASMREQDTAATWLMMTWVFYFERDNWTAERVKAFVEAVPQDKLMLLDYYCEHTEVWKMTHSYYGQPFIWCYLGNFGGNTMLAGNLSTVNDRVEQAFAKAGGNLRGVGSTLEGFDVNPLMYEFLFEKAWKTTVSNPDTWMNNYADRRCGNVDNACRQAWKLLLDSVYDQPASLGQATLTNARPTLTGSGNWTTNPGIGYNNTVLLKAWEKLLQVPFRDRAAYRYDIVNIGRQVLGNYFETVRNEFSDAYRKKDRPALSEKGREMIGLLTDMDSLLSTQSAFLLGKWLNAARSMGKGAAEKEYYERNARIILTTWGGRGQSLNDYANRAWEGLMGGYYKRRWELFVQSVERSVTAGHSFNEGSFFQESAALEWQWTQQHEIYRSGPAGDPVAISLRLIGKYSTAIRGPGSSQ